MKKHISLLLFLTLATASSVFAAPSPVIQADNQAIAHACAPDIALAGCQAAPTLKKAKKCMKSYAKSHPGFKHSPDCKAALRQHHLDKKAGR